MIYNNGYKNGCHLIWGGAFWTAGWLCAAPILLKWTSYPPHPDILIGKGGNSGLCCWQHECMNIWSCFILNPTLDPFSSMLPVWCSRWNIEQGNGFKYPLCQNVYRVTLGQSLSLMPLTWAISTQVIWQVWCCWKTWFLSCFPISLG